MATRSRFSLDFGSGTKYSRQKLARQHSTSILDEASRCKAVMVGDSQCGKSALVNTFLDKNNFIEVYKPTTFDRFSTTLEIAKHHIELNIWDTGGKPEYDFLRPLAYQDTDVVVVCFDISDPASLDRITKKWYPEIHKFCPQCPVILAGCKSDLRNDIHVMSRLTEQKMIPVSHIKGSSLAAKIGAVGYVECSSRTNKLGVCEVFEMAALASIGKLNLQKSYVDLSINNGKEPINKRLSIPESLRIKKRSSSTSSTKLRVRSTVIDKDSKPCVIM